MSVPTERPGAAMVELSHVLEDGLVTYRGLPGPVVRDYLSHEESRARYAEGTEFHIGRIDMVANTGTYLDSPFHRHAAGKDVSELPLASVAGLKGVLVEAGGGPGRAIDRSVFAGVECGGKAVLVHTGWARHWGTERYFDGHPYLTRDAAVHLADAGARLVGIDSLNIDDTGDGHRPVHTVLLEREIPIVEHLRGLEQLRGCAFRFFAVPLRVKGMGSFPVRAFAVLE